jgi:3-phytase
MRRTLSATLLALLLGACRTIPESALAVSISELGASGETQAVESRGDAADDPAIWLHPEDPDQSLIVGTDKQSGLYLYDLTGQVRQFVDAGRINNVDLRYGFRLEGEVIDLVAASNVSHNGIDLFRLDADTGRLTDVSLDRVRTDLAAIYGLCMGQNPENGLTYVYANSRDGTVYQYRAVPRGDRVALVRVRALKVATQVEGCVVDDRSGSFFLAEEQLGVWRFDAWPDGGRRGELIVHVGEHGLTSDVEGLAVFDLVAIGYLLVSSQGNNMFSVYDLEPPHSYRGSFKVTDGDLVDGVSETDGIDVTPAALGRYAGGLMVVQDGRNTQPEDNQNFKYLDWSTIADALGLELHPDYDPRSLSPAAQTGS